MNYSPSDVGSWEVIDIKDGEQLLQFHAGMSHQINDREIIILGGKDILGC
jgi:co-chaperonin GroES (HSP10)